MVTDYDVWVRARLVYMHGEEIKAFSRQLQLARLSNHCPRLFPNTPQIRKSDYKAITRVILLISAAFKRNVRNLQCLEAHIKRL